MFRWQGIRGGCNTCPIRFSFRILIGWCIAKTSLSARLFLLAVPRGYRGTLWVLPLHLLLQWLKQAHLLRLLPFSGRGFFGGNTHFSIYAIIARRYFYLALSDIKYPVQYLGGCEPG